MPHGAITLYSLSVFLHVTAVVVGFGATFAGAVLFPVASQVDARHIPYAHKVSLAIGRYLTTPALTLVILTGIYQTLDGPWGFEEPWIGATFAIAIVLGGLQGGYFTPTDRRLGAQAEQELAAGGLSDDYRRRAAVEARMGGLAGLLIVVALFLMITKPGS